MKKIILTLALLASLASLSSAQYGYKWVLKPSGTLSNLFGAYFLNSTTGYISGANGTVLVSTNSYSTWTSKSPGVNINLLSISSASPNTNAAVCCGENGTIFYTTNVGNNWVQLSSGTNSRLNFIKQIGTKLFAFGDGGVIISSAYSEGVYSPFVQYSSGTTQNLKAFCYNFDTLFYACGNNGTILKSSNQGLNWSSVFSPTNQNINSINSGYGFIEICCDNGLYYRSTNYGQNWINSPTGVSNSLNCIGYEFVAGSAGTILYNQLYGSGQVRWKRDVVPTASNLNYILNSYYEQNFVFGSNGTILRREVDSALIIRKINANNISTYMGYRGVFDQYLYTSNTPGFEWPSGSNKHVVFTTGLSAGCRINGQLAQTMCSYKGEYLPGAITGGQFNDSSIFKIYKVSGTDSPSSPDWSNWGSMVPYGAPYVDVNHNGIYEPQIDTPGVKNAAQTIFVCLTDFNPGSHNSGEGFGGGIVYPMMGIELHLTKWSYAYPSFNDVIFTKFEILNKGGSAWNNTHFSIVSDPDLGNASDDWVGCDTIRNMGFCYNGFNNDQIYGIAPPAVGFDILKGPVNKNVSPSVTYNMTSFVRFVSPNGTPPNEGDPNGEPYPAYLIMKGLKKDSSTWVDRTQPTPWGSYKKTKKIFYGDPETNEGWTSAKGYVSTWLQDSIGILLPEVPSDKRFVISMGADNYTVINGDTATIFLAQLVARGSSNLNSVTKLKQLSDLVQIFFESNFTIGINQISSEIPVEYSLSQNYPNPFNPETKIKYSVAKFSDVKLVVYDILGRKITELVNEKQAPGTYEILFDASSEQMRSLASGIYFYRLTVEDPLRRTGNFTDTKRMILIK